MIFNELYELISEDDRTWRNGQGYCEVQEQRISTLRWERVPGVHLKTTQGEEHDREPADQRVSNDQDEIMSIK